MAKHDSQAAQKRARNELYAAMFKRRSPAERKAARRARTAARDTRWLIQHGITPDPVKPQPSRRSRRPR